MYSDNEIQQINRKQKYLPTYVTYSLKCVTLLPPRGLCMNVLKPLIISMSTPQCKPAAMMEELVDPLSPFHFSKYDIYFYF